MRRAGRTIAMVLGAACALSACHLSQVTDLPTPGDVACPTPPTATAFGISGSPQLYAAAEQTRQAVLTTVRPARDLYALTQQVVLHSSTPIPHVIRSTPRNDPVGHEEAFWVTNASQQGYHQVQAKLVYETPHVYMYVEDGADADLASIKQSADLFEAHTYPTDEATYGPHWSPGVDDDPHVTVLNASDLGDVGGYFSSEDEYPQQVFRYSNERAMIYVNLAGGATPGSEFYNSTLAHEFQHMIHWYWHPSDPSWTNEGMSVLAQHLNGFSAEGLDDAFFEEPDTQLGGWSDDTPSMATHYGAGYLFNDYVLEHYGGSATLRTLVTDPNQVPLNYDSVLRAKGAAGGFDGVFADWTLANLLNDPRVAGGRYAYPTIPGKRATVQCTVTSYPFSAGSASAPATVHQYAARYYAFRPSGASDKTLTMSFNGSPYVPVIAGRPATGSGNEWWSNSGNDSETTLTHAFDLTHTGGQVTLNFQAWYDLEPSFDYAYVMVSTDNGQNWTPIAVSDSTDANPNAANLGHGVTSATGPKAGCRATSQWRPESADLSAYAGKHILLRFATISDDAVHCQGLALDQIRIPQLGYSDDAASDGGWQAAGFIRSGDIMTQHFAVAAVLYPTDGGAPSVQPVTVDPQTGKGTLTVANFASYDHVTLTVAAMAPGSVVPAQYQVQAAVGE